MSRSGLWLRWSARDLRHRWPVVVALALVIAIGTGAAAALGSMAQWRRLSNDASYSRLGMHDLAVTFDNARPPAERVLAAVRGIPHAGWLRAVEPRLDVATQVEIPAGERRVVLPGRMVGVDLTAGGPRIDRVMVTRGRALTPADAADPAAPPTAVLEQEFARAQGLPASGTLRLAGGTEVAYVGHGQSPEYLLNGSAALVGETTRAVLYLPLTTAQRLIGAQGQVTSVLLALAPGVDTAAVRAEVAAALAAALPDAPATLAVRTDDPGYRILYDDIDTDQQFWNVVAMLMLGGAALATLNLANRVVTAQRREMGVGMALGVPARTLAVRPLLFGVQVALLGALAGLAVGAVLGWAITGVLDDLLPLPVWRTPFQPGEFLRAAGLGVAIPLLGIAYPVVRVVRMQPADAIRTAHLSGGRGRLLARAFARVPLPGRTIWQLPVRHVLCAPGRAALTAVGVGAAICVLVAMLGMLDSFGAALDTGEREITRTVPDRVVVGLDGFYRVDDPRVTAIGTVPEVRAAQPALRLTGTAHTRSGPADGIDLVIDVLDFRTAMWTPTLRGAVAGAGSSAPAGAPAVPDGIVLAEKAATDLGVRPGDQIELRHARQVGDGRFTTASSRLTVAATHPQPMRPVAYLDQAGAAVFGLAGLANQVTVRPAAGVDEDELRAALLADRAVTDVRPVAAATQATRDMVSQFTGVLTLLDGFVLVLALLIAFNAASVNADERRREHATMLAFGLPPRVVLGNAMAESLIVGLLGTAAGIGAGIVATRWAVTNLSEQSMPDLGLTPSLTVNAVFVAVTVGVVAVTLAPLLTARRLRRMIIPATLRVVE